MDGFKEAIKGRCYTVRSTVRHSDELCKSDTFYPEPTVPRHSSQPSGVFVVLVFIFAFVISAVIDKFLIGW